MFGAIWGMGFHRARMGGGDGFPSPPWRGDAEGPLHETAGLGFGIFLVSLGVMFAATLLVLTILLWSRGGDPEGLELPWVLWPASACALLLPLLAGHARRLVMRGASRAVLRPWFYGASLCSALLLGLQLMALMHVAEQNPAFHIDRLLLFSFYTLVGLHVLHSAIGLFGLLWVARRAAKGRYRRDRSAGLTVCGLYQGFVACSWLLVMLTLHVQQRLA